MKNFKYLLLVSCFAFVQNSYATDTCIELDLDALTIDSSESGSDNDVEGENVYKGYLN